ncbi:MAG: hypothetical protein WD208_02180 [Dehalococcoidia bacterium]
MHSPEADMSVGSDVREWAASAWEGGITNVGWFWAVVAIILNVLATSLIVAAVVEGGQTERVLNRVALAALIPVVVLVSLQVPYRGQRMRAQRRIGSAANPIGGGGR